VHRVCVPHIGQHVCRSSWGKLAQKVQSNTLLFHVPLQCSFQQSSQAVQCAGCAAWWPAKTWSSLNSRGPNRCKQAIQKYVQMYIHIAWLHTYMVPDCQIGNACCLRCVNMCSTSHGTLPCSIIYRLPHMMGCVLCVIALCVATFISRLFVRLVGCTCCS
jgi:hypothetical protein